MRPPLSTLRPPSRRRRRSRSLPRGAWQRRARTRSPVGRRTVAGQIDLFVSLMRSNVYVNLNLGIHFIRGTWSDDPPTPGRVRMYDRLQARFCPAACISYATEHVP